MAVHTLHMSSCIVVQCLQASEDTQSHLLCYKICGHVWRYQSHGTNLRASWTISLTAQHQDYLATQTVADMEGLLTIIILAPGVSADYTI